MHEFSINPAWNQYEFNTIPQFKFILQLQKFQDFLQQSGLAVWIFSFQQMCFHPFCGNAWIQHEWISSIFWHPQNSKPRIQNTIHTNLAPFFWLFWPSFHRIRFMSFHAGFNHISIYAEFMSDSCRIQLNSVLPFIHIPLDCFHAVLNPILCFLNGSDRLVLDSCWNHADFILTLNFHNALRNILHHNGVEFMLKSCWLQAKPWELPRIAN